MNNPECEQNIKYNSDGFVGPEFPISNSKDYYDILITGGSVSAQFGPGIKCNNKKNNFCIDFLGEALKNYSSEKKPIRILIQVLELINILINRSYRYSLEKILI